MVLLQKTKNILSGIYQIIKLTVNKFLDDNVIKLGASLSYYTLFSIPPLFIIIISIAGIFFGEEAIRGELVNQIEDVVGSSAAHFIQSTLTNIKVWQHGSLAALISMGVLIFSASTVFAEIQSSINLIWGLRTKPNKSLIQFLKNRFISFLMILSLGAILISSLIINSVVNVIGYRLLSILELGQLNLLKQLNTLVVYLTITILFAVILKTLPDAKIRFRDAIVGAFFTSTLFMIGNFLISIYIPKSNINDIFGAAASVAILMTWVYYSAIILYFGAEFTKVYAETYGEKIIPNEYTDLIIKEDYVFYEKEEIDEEE